jgi:translocation protein SEC63
MCDSYVGSDKVIPVKLRVMPLTRAAQEGRDAKARQQLADSSDDEDDNDGE